MTMKSFLRTSEVDKHFFQVFIFARAHRWHFGQKAARIPKLINSTQMVALSKIKHINVCMYYISTDDIPFIYCKTFTNNIRDKEMRYWRNLALFTI